MGADFIAELVQAYFDETPQLLSNLQEALARQDCEAFRRAAHSIKSTSNSFGALQFGAAGKRTGDDGQRRQSGWSTWKSEDACQPVMELCRQALEELSHG